MIEPETVAMAICKSTSNPATASVTLRRVSDRMMIHAYGSAYLSRREAEHLRRMISRIIRELAELEADAAKDSKP